MGPGVTLLATLAANKPTYIRFKPFVKEHTMGKETWELFQFLEKYFEAYPKGDSVNWDEYQSFFFLLKGKTKPEKAAMYLDIIEQCKTAKTETDDSSPVLKAMLEDCVEKDYATRIANQAFELATSGKTKVSIQSIKELCEDYEEELGKAVNVESLFVSDDLEKITSKVATGGYEWRLEELNQSLGPLRNGDFIIVGARPEKGKTTFLASEVTNFVTQLPAGSGPIIWVNNEERSEKVKYRVIQAFLGVTTADLMSNLDDYAEAYKKACGGRILITDDEAGLNNIKNLDALFYKLKPSLIIIDQLDKVVGFNNEDREDQRLGRLYQWARDNAKKFGPVIAASQIDASAAGLMYVSEEKLRGSKTDKAGEADAIIMLGFDADPSKPNRRGLHLPKNKLFGGPRSKPELRHGCFEIEIQPEIARFKGMISK